jgi:hypothetical protein
MHESFFYSLAGLIPFFFRLVHPLEEENKVGRVGRIETALAAVQISDYA